MSLASIYTNRIAEFTIITNSLRKQRNIITFSKVLVFCSIAYLCYCFLASGQGDKVGEYGMGFLYGAIVCVPFYVLLSVMDSKVFRKINRYNALIQCSNTELAYLKGDYNNLQKGAEFINPLHPYTHDLDIFGEDSLYMEMNRTITRNGSLKLAEILETNCKDSKEIQQRQQAITELKEKIDFCHNFRAAGISKPTGELESEIIRQWIAEKPFFKNWNYVMPLVYLGNILMAGLLMAAYIWGIKIGYIAIVFLIQLLVVMYKAQQVNHLIARLGRFIKALSNYIYLIEELKRENFASAQMQQIKNDIFGEKDAVQAFKKLKRIQNTLDSRMNILLMVILNGFYMRDFHTVYRLDRWKREYLGQVPQWIESISLLDAYVSMANYSFNHREYVMPQFSANLPEASGPVLSAVSLGHPLLHGENIVTNDFGIELLHNFYIITGANMAGKSTFLRAVGINMVLALSGNPVFAKDFICTPINLFTSMRTTDNLAKGTSYFHAELLRLKSLIDMAHTSPLFIILDEMLKGTNSKDKLNGSIKFLEKLLTLPVCGVVATHDLALGEMKHTYPSNFKNVCFEIEHSSEDIHYDYKLKDGVSKNMNASILLEKMGIV